MVTSYSVKSTVRGYHVYEDSWEVEEDEILLREVWRYPVSCYFIYACG